MSRVRFSRLLASAPGMIVLALVLAAKPASAQYTFYTDLSSWSAAVNNTFVTEDFSDTILNPGLSYTTNNGSISGGKYNDSLFSFRRTTFTFTPPVYAVGANFDLSPNGVGVGVQFQLNTEDGLITVTQEVPNTAKGGFYGIVSNYTITQFIIKAGNQTGIGPGETYNLDNLRYSAVVPEPGEYATAGIFMGFLAFGLIRARRRATANIPTG